jgi:hypothetical protein
MSLLAPLDNKIIKKEPQELYPNLFDKSVIDVSGINFGDETLSGYEEHDVSIQLSGALTNTCQGRITRVGRLVSVELINMSGTTSANTTIQTSAFIPASCRIAAGQVLYGIFWGLVGFDAVPISATVNFQGIVELTASAVSGSNLIVSNFFPNATTVGFSRVSIMYSI